LKWGIVPGFWVDGIIRRVGVHDQLINILKSEGWEAANPDTLVYFNPPIEGIIISVRNLDSVQPHLSILHRAFEAIGMPAKIKVEDSAGQPPIQLFVGHKPLS
jgi:hypothetical protein